MELNSASLFNINVSVLEDHCAPFNFAQVLASTKSMQGNDEPFFVADIGRIKTLVKHWLSRLPRVRPFYSVNCNSNEVLLRVLSSYPRIGFHCITRDNVDAVVEHVSTDRIFYTNSCWTKRTLNNAEQRDISMLSVESEDDLYRMAESGISAKLLLNVCFDSTTDDAAAGMGCTIIEAPELLQLSAALGLNCAGISFNLGSSCGRPMLYNAAIQFAKQLFCIGDAFGLEMNVLSVGGGFAYGGESFNAVCEQINESLDTLFPEEKFPNLQIIATPGRFFAAPIFSLVTSIIAKSDADAKEFTNDEFDSGRQAFKYQINEGYYGAFGCRVVANCEPKAQPLFTDELDDTEKFYGTVIGPTVDDPFDVVQPICQFRQMSVGDWLLWANMGAYSMNNEGSLDVDKPIGLSVYYYAKKSDWKLLDSLMDTYGDHCCEEESISDDSAVETDMDEDVAWFIGSFADNVGVLFHSD